LEGGGLGGEYPPGGVRAGKGGNDRREARIRKKKGINASHKKKLENLNNLRKEGGEIVAIDLEALDKIPRCLI